jgi:hypothetical protein
LNWGLKLREGRAALDAHPKADEAGLRMGHPELWWVDVELLCLGGELAEDVLEDAAVLVVEDLLRGVDADGDGELDGGAGHVFGEDDERFSGGEFAVEHVFEADDVVNLFAGEGEGFGGVAGLELQREDAHANQVRPVDALVGFGDDEADAEQARTLGGPVARGA